MLAEFDEKYSTVVLLQSEVLQLLLQHCFTFKSRAYFQIAGRLSLGTFH